MRLAEQLAAEAETIARDAERIEALSRTRPHAFCEDKDAIARRMDALAVKIRNGFGGTPARKAPIVPGTIVAPSFGGRPGRPIRVEIRRRVAG